MENNESSNNNADDINDYKFKPQHKETSLSIEDSKISESILDDRATEVVKISIDSLVPYRDSDKYPSQSFGGSRLEDLADSIKRIGLEKPITVRRYDDGRYQILSGHNRVAATKLLGHDMISAIIKENISDDEANDIYFDSNLNQQSFKDWNYSQRLDAIKYTDKKIREKSEQGKRSDLAGDKTNVQIRQKSNTPTTRDKMSVRLGIAPATFSKYRSIIKLDDGILDDLSEMLDKKRISLEIAYRISQLKQKEIELLMNWLKSNSNVAFKGEESNDVFKQLYAKSKGIQKQLTIKEMVAVIQPNG